MKTLDEHLAEFKRVGFTLFPGMLDADWVCEMRAAFDAIADRVATVDGRRPAALVDVLEHQPQLVLRALANERLLDFAESVIGPHVQLESVTYPRSPPDAADAGPVLGFHRDMFAFFPDDGVYHRPLLFNVLSYLQDLTDEVLPHPQPFLAEASRQLPGTGVAGRDRASATTAACCACSASTTSLCSAPTAAS